MRISIVMSGRNDDYGVGFLDRMQSSVDNLFRQARRSGLDAELVFVEWNNPSGVKSFLEAIDWSQSSFPVRIIHVPQNVHDGLPRSEEINWFWSQSLNIGIRRANGQFVLNTTPDILYSDWMIRYLATAVLDENCIYLATRYDVNAVEVVSARKTEEGYPFHTNAVGDFTLMAKSRWEQLRGYPELPFNTYNDARLVVMAVNSGLRQVVLDAPIYHVNHDHSAADGIYHYAVDWKDGLFPNEHDNWGFQDITFPETVIYPGGKYVQY